MDSKLFFPSVPHSVSRPGQPSNKGGWGEEVVGLGNVGREKGCRGVEFGGEGERTE